MVDNSKDLIERIWGFFSSMKLGLALLGVIAFVSGIGTIVPQIEQSPEKAEAVSQLWQTMGFTHLYSAVWFRLLLGLLCINLIVCSTQRFRGIYLRTFKLTPPLNLARIPQKNQLVVQGELASLRESVQEVLRQKGFRFKLNDQSGHWSFIAIKRRLGNWGSLITHLSFVVLVIGALLGSLLGFKGYFMEGSGTTIAIREIEVSKGRVSETFSVRVNSAEDRFLPNGERDNWYTDLSVLENGEEVARKTLSVNHPFKYKGVTFYQASFANGALFTAEMNGQKKPVVLRDQRQSYYQAPGTDLYLVTTLAKSLSQNPDVLYQVYKGTGVNPIQTGQLKTGETIDVQGTYRLTYEGLAGFTGLQVKKDPGVAVIWLGCGLLLGGLLLAFYWQPLVISGIIQSENGKRGTLTVGALSGKMPDSTNRALEQFVSSIKTTMGK
ncbi:cytochrome c biogenesis protein ResB [Desulfosporosinus fructosivorans]|uniref:Cytochrome c biogenesis protein ResB n=1 Tax=Desulfosporosinus fructosivorans TaxID=2018669 RepID=A0A4Z0R6J8_9FIRM|nr:cytochrome c biogenesis protein ResB [Desulfosporosinus fructosivorans]TGE37587.1 cytochrome c biogenesis protein ResB [Desulfosporosinus fructosivorans]